MSDPIRHLAERVTRAKETLEQLADDIDKYGLPRERDHVERAAEELDYATDSLMAIARGDD